MLANRRVYLDYYKAFTHQCDGKYILAFRRKIELGIQLTVLHISEFLKRKDVLEELRAEKFDIIISEQLHLCGTGLKHVLDIPTHILVNRYNGIRATCVKMETITAVQ